LPNAIRQGKEINFGMEAAIPGAIATEQIAQAIRTNFPLTPLPAIPEISVHRATPTSGLRRFAEADPDFGNPYWAYSWGGGLALARHILDHPEIVAGRRVIDLDCGSGLVAIAAALAGAQVDAIDVDRYAVIATGLNAAANNVRVSPLHADILPGPAPGADLILVGDLFYDAALADRVTRFLDRCLAAGIDILIGDPGRTTLPRHRLREIASYPGGDFGSSPADHTHNAVYSFTAP
jgi:predicted nicotinamide N-methyase